MKLKFGILMLGAVAFMASCGDGQKPGGEVDAQEHEGHEEHAHDGGHSHEGHEEHGHEESQGAEAMGNIIPVDHVNSSITWKIDKVFSDGHTGTVSLKSGEMTTDEEGNLVGGNFVVDLNSLTSTDMEDGDHKTDMVNHLKGIGEEGADDFFNVTVHPEASLEITSVSNEGEEHIATGNLTIKGTTQEVTFPFTMGGKGEDYFAKCSMTIDRTKFGITHNSQNFAKNVADNYLIKDEFTLDILLRAGAMN
mgnify:CR=1 FL=1